jgi:hypothetical protein
MLKDLDVVHLPSTDVSNENRELTSIFGRVKELREKYDPVALVKDIRSLQEASRIQNLRPEVRDPLLRELQRRKLIHQIVSGE